MARIDFIENVEYTLVCQLLVSKYVFTEEDTVFVKYVILTTKCALIMHFVEIDDECI